MKKHRRTRLPFDDRLIVRCCGKVKNFGSLLPCPYEGKHMHKEKPYCLIHHPNNVAARKKKSQEKHFKDERRKEMHSLEYALKIPGLSSESMGVLIAAIKHRKNIVKRGKANE